MKLPNREKAHVPQAKLTGYLLSETHMVGRFKAQFFKRLGFSQSNADELAQALLAIAQTEEVTEVVTTPYGTKFILDGWLQTPSGERVRVRTVWIVEKGQTCPRLVTVYPI